MANQFSAFMANRVKKVKLKEVVVSDRMVNEAGEPEKWKIKTLSASEDKALRKRNTHVANSLKTGSAGYFDNVEYMDDIVVECVVYPDLNDAELQASYEINGAKALLGKMLTAGEYNTLLQAVLDNNEITTMAEKIEEAKN